MKQSKLIKVINLAFSLTLLALPAAADQGGTTKLRVVAYNVACGQWATPEQIAEQLKPLAPDIVLLSEGLKVTDAKIVGEDKEHADIVVSPYPSDHRAVVATITIPNPEETKQK